MGGPAARVVAVLGGQDAARLSAAVDRTGLAVTEPPVMHSAEETAEAVVRAVSEPGVRFAIVSQARATALLSERDAIRMLMAAATAERRVPMALVSRPRDGEFLNAGGVRWMEDHGVSVVASLEDAVRVMNDRLQTFVSLPQEARTRSADAFGDMDVSYGEDPLGDGDEDPFDALDGDGGDDGEWDDDWDGDADGPWEGVNVAAGDGPAIEEALPGDPDASLPPSEADAASEAAPYAGMTGEAAPRDIARVLAPTYGEPAFDYSYAREDERESGSFLSRVLGGGRRGGRDISNFYQNSAYIAERNREAGIYNPPDGCRVIACYSPEGGSGKTTVSTMIASQLVWDFNRGFLMGETAEMRSRVLVISTNENDDINVKGIGRSLSELVGPDVAAAGRPSSLTLRRIIDDSAGEPLTWRQIRHCFEMNPSNGVLYLPSPSLAELFEAGRSLEWEDYKAIIDACREFFAFIVVDSPDGLYSMRGGITAKFISEADVLVLVMGQDVKSVSCMYNFIDGIRSASKDGRVPLDRNTTMLVVNRVVTPDNPYVRGSHAELPAFSDIANAFTAMVSHVEPIPLGDPFMARNVLFGQDRNVKVAASAVTDDVLEMIDRRDGTNGVGV